MTTEARGSLPTVTAAVPSVTVRTSRAPKVISSHRLRKATSARATIRPMKNPSTAAPASRPNASPKPPRNPRKEKLMIRNATAPAIPPPSPPTRPRRHFRLGTTNARPTPIRLPSIPQPMTRLTTSQAGPAAVACTKP